MSELRDLTSALRSLDRRVSSVEECLLELVRDSRQATDWRHQQRNRVMLDDERREGQERAMIQVQEACGAISHRLAEVAERLDNQVATRQSDVKWLGSRVRELELKAGTEVTE